MATNTIHIHRVLCASPKKIYGAFLNEGALLKWLPPNGFTGKVHALDVRVGGHYRMSFTNFTTGKVHVFSGTYLALDPYELIRYTNHFEDESPTDEMETTIRLQEVSCGTELIIEQAGVPDVIPREVCYLGWQESLFLLAKLVEPDILD